MPGTTTCLVYGRGPSYLTLDINESNYDRIIKLKRCDCSRDPNRRCDVLVLYKDELHLNDAKEYDVHTCPVLKVWEFSPLVAVEEKNRPVHDHLKNKSVSIINGSAPGFRLLARRFGFEIDRYPRFSTGLAAILEALRVCAHPVTIVAFDNIAHNKSFGEYDNPSRLGCIRNMRCERQHDIAKEFEVIQVLKRIGAIRVPNITRVPERYESSAKIVIAQKGRSNISRRI
ncbi:hypothetical protein CYMTET_24020 [Cymbomonas tetramitiformis]|uniref:Uncharacterized protein n=1 Tax=Cymbomonas tetramitiformis TaxID=36881 RepID=A0AAE0L0I0_9CHLO|nr:hypothetical protein CYMTET_24020 [Cymbomonas tetramitiformis]